MTRPHLAALPVDSPTLRLSAAGLRLGGGGAGLVLAIAIGHRSLLGSILGPLQLTDVGEGGLGGGGFPAGVLIPDVVQSRLWTPSIILDNHNIMISPVEKDFSSFFLLGAPDDLDLVLVLLWCGVTGWLPGLTRPPSS